MGDYDTMMNEAEAGRVYLFPHTIRIEKVDNHVLMVARNWFQTFTMAEIARLKSLTSGEKGVKVGGFDSDRYLARLSDDSRYIILDDTEEPRTIQLLVSSISGF